MSAHTRKRKKKWLLIMRITDKKSMREGKDIYNVNLIYSRILGLQQSRRIDFKDVLKHELAPIPTSMFRSSGKMRIASGKSSLKNKLKVGLFPPFYSGFRHSDFRWLCYSLVCPLAMQWVSARLCRQFLQLCHTENKPCTYLPCLWQQHQKLNQIRSLWIARYRTPSSQPDRSTPTPESIVFIVTENKTQLIT